MLIVGSKEQAPGLGAQALLALHLREAENEAFLEHLKLMYALRATCQALNINLGGIWHTAVCINFLAFQIVEFWRTNCFILN